MSLCIDPVACHCFPRLSNGAPTSASSDALDFLIHGLLLRMQSRIEHTLCGGLPSRCPRCYGINPTFQPSIQTKAEALFW